MYFIAINIYAHQTFDRIYKSVKNQNNFVRIYMKIASNYMGTVVFVLNLTTMVSTINHHQVTNK